ncbi:cardiolipin synthase [Bacillus sp. 1NLA3E]|uniref:cardiolipin synthase n=1 Tax=Bacillus sp. 1NLA3E TaxID=666686 RepID=UPI0005A11841|nr:cardiolipin synthase [Bacillus sp. 1NLA3E]
MFLTVFTIILILIIWLYFDYTLGRRQQLACRDRKDYPIRNSQFHLFTHGPELFDDLFREIKNAQKHVHVLFYIAKNDTFSREFFSILKAKAREGVEVRLLLDRLGSIKVSEQIIHELKEANVKFSFSHVPKLPFLFYSVNVRNHRKITIIDGKIGYAGGYNVGQEYINLEPSLSPWRDYHLKFTGEVVHDLQQVFLKDWHIATKSELITHPTYFPHIGQGPMSIQVVSSDGGHIEDAFSNQIRKARKSIFIGTPYFIPSKMLFADLLEAARRGVKIIILVPHKADHILVKEASFPYYRQLIKAGAEIYQFLNGFYHAKIILFDEDICDIGTSNFDQRSIFLNFELNCFIYDSGTIAKIKTIIDHDLNDSKKLSLDELNNVSLLTKTKEIIAKPLERFL